MASLPSNDPDPTNLGPDIAQNVVKNQLTAQFQQMTLTEMQIEPSNDTTSSGVTGVLAVNEEIDENHHSPEDEGHGIPAPSQPRAGAHAVKTLRNDFGVPMERVTKAEISVLRPHWKFTTRIYRNEGDTKARWIHLTEQEAIRLYRMKNKVFVRKQGGNAAEDARIESNLKKYEKYIRRVIRKGILARRAGKMADKYDGSDDDVMAQDLAQYDSTEDEVGG